MVSILVGLIFLYSATALPFDGRIVNGTDAAEGEIPYIISLKYNLEHNCGGSILNENWVLTAAHCVVDKDPQGLSVQYGLTSISSDGLYTISADFVTIHSGYVPSDGYINDVAVIRLSSPLTFSTTVQPVKLPPAYNATPEGVDAVLAGWGYPYSGGDVMENLQKVDIKVYSDEDCERIYATKGPTDRKYHVCAGVPEGGKGQCSGDSGGPLIANGVQVGIVSWSEKPCTVQGYPGVFVKVSSYVDWINEQITTKS